MSKDDAMQWFLREYYSGAGATLPPFEGIMSDIVARGETEWHCKHPEVEIGPTHFLCNDCGVMAPLPEALYDDE